MNVTKPSVEIIDMKDYDEMIRKIEKRLYVQNFKTGISLSQNENADALDKQLFCIYRWRCPAGSSKTVYRKPENIAETKG